MSQPHPGQVYPRPFTYDEAINAVAENIGEVFHGARNQMVAMTGAAYALSIAYNLSIIQVDSDLRSQVVALEAAKRLEKLSA